MNKFRKPEIFLLAIVAFLFVACEQNEVTTQKDYDKTISQEQLKMRSVLETTTNILLEMIASDQNYFDELNKLIVAESPNYLEDRVMLKDLFGKTSKSNASYVSTNANKFTSDFYRAFIKNRPQKVDEINEVNSNLLLNPDSLIEFLCDNNVSLYCPYPLEDYSEDNRVPTITYHPIINDSVNIGFLLDKAGDISFVNVSQDYADINPVWIIMPNDKELINRPINSSNATKVAPAEGFEVDIKQIYCSEYYDNKWLFNGDLDIIFMRSKSAGLNMSTWRFEGTFDVLKTFILPRKYVRYAKNGWIKGWCPVNYIWDYEWESNSVEQILTIFEHDPVSSTEFIATARLKLDADVKVSDEIIKAGTEVGVQYKSTYNSQDAPITIETIGRDKFYDIVRVCC